MPIVDIRFTDGAFEDIGPERLSWGDPDALRFAILDHGMQSGLPSVAIGFPLPEVAADDGAAEWAIVQTSARALVTVAKAILARYPDLFFDGE